MRIFRNLKTVLVLLVAVVAVSSCTSHKKVPYLQNSSDVDFAAVQGMYEAKIMPQDLLTIIVTNPEDNLSSYAYNLMVPASMDRTSSSISQPVLQNYLVDNDGCVNIPNIGNVKIAGMSIPEAEKTVLEKVKGAFSATPVVTVRFADFKISVLGEVTSPGSFTIKNGKVNIYQALALARDLTIYGQRDNVKILREKADGKKEIVEVNLNDANIINSPNFYLQQNDVVYVTPNKSKAKNSDIGSSTSLWFSGTSILISLTSLLYNILK